MKNRIAVLTLALVVGTSAYAADRKTTVITVPGADGKTLTKTVSNTLLTSDGIATVCGTPLHHGGILPDGVRTLNCDGTGSYIDGTHTGTFKWYYAVSDTDKSKLFIKSFKEWGMGPAATDDPAVVVYMIYKGGSLDGKTYGAVIGVVQGQIQLSPVFASKKK